MDSPSLASRFAIVAPQDALHSLGQMYHALREVKAGSTKQVNVFRSRDDALEWLAGSDRER
jgi:hypothetical protein